MRRYKVYYRNDWSTSDQTLSASDIGDAIDRFTKAMELLCSPVGIITKVELIEDGD